WFGDIYVLMRTSNTAFAGIVSIWLASAVGVGTTAALLVAFGSSVLERARRGESQTEPGRRGALVRACRWAGGAGLGVAVLSGGASEVLSRTGHRHVVRSAALVATYLTVTVALALNFAVVTTVIATIVISAFAAAVGTLVGLLNGLTGPDVAKRTVPNQG